MTQKKETGKNKRRTQVEDLPKAQKELNKDEQKKVKGGAGTAVSMDLYTKK